jgi:anti-anti-sigma factor
MKVIIEEFGEVRQARVEGKINSLTAPEFEIELERALQGEPKHLIVNLAQVDFLSSAGLRSILRIAKRLEKKELKLAFAGAGDLVAEVIRISGVDSLFPLCTTPREASERLLA